MQTTLSFQRYLTWFLFAFSGFIWISSSSCSTAPKQEYPREKDLSETSTERAALPDKKSPDLSEMSTEKTTLPDKKPSDSSVLDENLSDRNKPDTRVSDKNCASTPKKRVRNIVYDKIKGIDPNLLSLDLGIPSRKDGCKLVPVVFWIHGGAWVTGDKNRKTVAQKAALFFKAGYGIVSINYRLTQTKPLAADEKKIMHPIHAQDVAKAYHWVLSNIERYGGDPKQVMILGHSTGAQLAALLSTDESYLKAHGRKLSQIRCVGSFDTEGYDIPFTMKTAGASLKKTYTRAFGNDPKVWKQASPVNYLAKGKGIPPFLFARRGNARRQTQLDKFIKDLHKINVEAEAIHAEKLDHAGINNSIGAKNDKIMTPPLMKFLKKCFSSR